MKNFWDEAVEDVIEEISKEQDFEHAQEMLEVAKVLAVLAEESSVG